MSDFGKWTYRILILVLVVAVIDLNVNQPKAPTGLPLPKDAANLILGGALVLVLLIRLILKKKNK